jgi:hypothetical protein
MLAEAFLSQVGTKLNVCCTLLTEKNSIHKSEIRDLKKDLDVLPAKAA